MLNVYKLSWSAKNTAKHIERMKEVLPFSPFYRSNRMVCSLGKDYPYSGQVAKAHPFSLYPALEALMSKINSELGTDFNSALINWYPKGTRCGINKHSDNEPELLHGDQSVVVSVSLGQACTFILSPNQGGRDTHILLEDGDILVMGAGTQKTHKHSIAYSIMPADRISITFRCFK